MSEPSVTEPGVAPVTRQSMAVVPGHDDDDDFDDADFDDEDEPSISRHDRWGSRLGFGSPEWWSRI